ncbi:hypothetical protein MAUB1S_08202 [Mycolicibacterium aubagnense]
MQTERRHDETEARIRATVMTGLCKAMHAAGTTIYGRFPRPLVRSMVSLWSGS